MKKRGTTRAGRRLELPSNTAVVPPNSSFRRLDRISRANSISALPEELLGDYVARSAFQRPFTLAFRRGLSERSVNPTDGSASHAPAPRMSNPRTDPPWRCRFSPRRPARTSARAVILAAEKPEEVRERGVAPMPIQSQRAAAALTCPPGRAHADRASRCKETPLRQGSASSCKTQRPGDTCSTLPDTFVKANGCLSSFI